MRRRWVVLVVLILVAGVSVALLGRGRQAAPSADPVPPAVPVEVAKVQEGSVVRTVEVSGTVGSARSADIVARIGGRVARVLVEDGARVSSGQPLIELDAADQRIDLRQAQAAVNAAEARLALLLSGLRPQERQVVYNAYTQAQNQVTAAETQVAVSQAGLKVAEDNLRRQEMLLREGAVAQAQVDQARLQFEQARAQVQAAQSQLEIAKTAVDSARQQWDMTQTGARQEEIRAARAQVAQARAVVAQAQQRLAYMTIRAPFAGRVTGVSLSTGDYVSSGDFSGRAGAVARVYDDRAMEVEVKVGERDIPLLRVGQPATMRLEGTSEAAVEAVVSVISPAADPMSRSSNVRLRLKETPGTVVPGTFARGEVTVERRPGVLLVPAVAVSGGNTPVVRAVVDGVVQVRPVTVGLSQGDRVEVRTGLSADDIVVTLGPENLPAGTVVKVVNQ